MSSNGLEVDDKGGLGGHSGVLALIVHDDPVHFVDEMQIYELDRDDEQAPAEGPRTHPRSALSWTQTCSHATLLWLKSAAR